MAEKVYRGTMVQVWLPSKPLRGPLQRHILGNVAKIIKDQCLVFDEVLDVQIQEHETDAEGGAA